MDLVNVSRSQVRQVTFPCMSRKLGSEDLQVTFTRSSTSANRLTDALAYGKQVERSLDNFSANDRDDGFTGRTETIVDGSVFDRAIVEVFFAPPGLNKDLVEDGEDVSEYMEKCKRCLRSVLPPPRPKRCSPQQVKNQSWENAHQAS